MKGKQNMIAPIYPTSGNNISIQAYVGSMQIGKSVRSMISIVCCIFLLQVSQAQSIRTLTSGRKTSIRGLSVVNDRVVWVSGSNGTVGRTTDGGINWEWQTIPGLNKTDFRDIEAFDAETAVIMGISEPGYILKTRDGGVNWKVVLADSTKGIFLDAMEFSADGHGVVIGDPIGGRMYMAVTNDFGDSWQRTEAGNLPLLAEGEAFFASSGTNVRFLNGRSPVIVTGGAASRFIHDGRITEMPIRQGGQSTGANSVAVWQKGKRKARIVVVGGDFSKDTLQAGNCIISTDKGKTWQPPRTAPKGYRSSVEFLDADKLITCGTSGVDISNDGGINWKNISPEGFHVCRKAKSGTAVFLAGSNGRVARWEP